MSLKNEPKPVRKAGAHPLSYYNPATHTVGVYLNPLDTEDSVQKALALKTAEQNFQRLKKEMNPFWQSVLTGLFLAEEGLLTLANVSNSLTVELKEPSFFSKGKHTAYDSKKDILYLDNTFQQAEIPPVTPETLTDEKPFVYGLLLRPLVFAMQKNLNYMIDSQTGFSAKQRALNQLVIEADAKALVEMSETMWHCFGTLSPQKGSQMRPIPSTTTYPKPKTVLQMEGFLFALKKNKNNIYEAKWFYAHQVLANLLACRDYIWHNTIEKKILRLLWKDLVLDRLGEERQGDTVAHAYMLDGIAQKYNISGRKIKIHYHIGNQLNRVMSFILRNLTRPKEELLEAVNHVYINGRYNSNRKDLPLDPIFHNAEEDQENFFE